MNVYPTHLVKICQRLSCSSIHTTPRYNDAQRPFLTSGSESHYLSHTFLTRKRRCGVIYESRCSLSHSRVDMVTPLVVFVVLAQMEPVHCESSSTCFKPSSRLRLSKDSLLSRVFTMCMHCFMRAVTMGNNEQILAIANPREEMSRFVAACASLCQSDGTE